MVPVFGQSSMNPQIQFATMGLPQRVDALAGIVASASFTDGTGQAVDAEKTMTAIRRLLEDTKDSSATVYIVGNGGSAAVASHAVTDFLNVGQLRATTIHDPSNLTCMANDYGYENAYANMLKILARPGDVLIAISSSGKSANILNAVRRMREKPAVIVTLSGFSFDNPLRTLGDFNIWLDSSDYGHVEIGHQFVLHNLADRLRLGM